MNLSDSDALDIMKMYFILHHHGGWSKMCIDDMKPYEAEYYLNELMRAKENEQKEYNKNG